MESVECAGFVFSADFDSGNFLKAEIVNKKETRVTKASSYSDDPDIEFNIWTRPDCYGTPYENQNRTWFYFGVKGGAPHSLVKLNIVDVNKQTKMYSQGMAPVTRIIPGNKCNWERIRDRISYMYIGNSFTLSFRYFVPENVKCTQYFAFTYPFTYNELQNNLISMDQKYLTTPGPVTIDDIYYVRECICKSLEGRRVDLITISSYHNITIERETRLKNLFCDKTVNRPFKFHDKKVIFVSARVHPGETPASFVFNGFLNLLLTRDNPIAIALRRLYVFKLIPFLNPDGVVRGHYRTDTQGVNLNRLYLNPSVTNHPSVYAARALIRYHHWGYERPDDDFENISEAGSSSSDCSSKHETFNNNDLSPDRTFECIKCNKTFVKTYIPSGGNEKYCDICRNLVEMKNRNNNPEDQTDTSLVGDGDVVKTSGLFLYIDLHGHASKKGIFMYGNHFKDQKSNVECMLLPKLMAMNNSNFHFYACNFTEKNMYLKDKRDGLSREGSGRVAVLKLTGLIQSYTLECNYNTGRTVNIVPPQVRECTTKSSPNIVPPKFTPHIYEETGRAMGPSILDLTGDNPCSRLPNSEFRTLNNMREWLKWYLVGQLASPTDSSKTMSQIPRTAIVPRRTPVKPPKVSRIPNRGNILPRSSSRNENKDTSKPLNQQPPSTSYQPRGSKTALSKFTTNSKEVPVTQSLEETSKGDCKYRAQTASPTTSRKVVLTPSSGEYSEVTKLNIKRLRTSAVPSKSSKSAVVINNEYARPKMKIVRSADREKLRDMRKSGSKETKFSVASTSGVAQTSTEVVNKDKIVWKPGKSRSIDVPNSGQVTTKSPIRRFHHPTSKIFKTEFRPTGNKLNQPPKNLKKARVRKSLRRGRLVTSTEISFEIIKNVKLKKKKAKFIK